MENFELSDCIYEHIKDTYYYGLFGDFKLVIDKATGCFNATKLCAEGGKNLFNWKRLEKSKKMVEYYQENWPSHVKANFLYEIKDANKDKIGKQITGTYVPKELILEIASWVSIEFYDKCNQVIITYFVNEFKKMDKSNLEEKIKEVEENMEKMTLEKDIVIVENNELKAILLRLEESNLRLEKSRESDKQYMRSLGISLEEVKDQNDTLIDQNEELLGETKGLKKQNKKIQRKLGIAVEDRAPLPDDKGKQERFVLLKRNDDDHMPYYTIRAQNAYTKRKIKVLRTLFPNLEILLDFKANPNSKTLYVRIKDELKVKGVLFEGNNINLEDSSITEEDLIEEMEVINDQKRDI